MTTNIWSLADALYRKGYEAHEKGLDYDPRGCEAWQDVVDVVDELTEKSTSQQGTVLWQWRINHSQAGPSPWVECSSEYAEYVFRTGAPYEIRELCVKTFHEASHDSANSSPT